MPQLHTSLLNEKSSHPHLLLNTEAHRRDDPLRFEALVTVRAAILAPARRRGLVQTDVDSRSVRSSYLHLNKDILETYCAHNFSKYFLTNSDHR